MPLESGHFKLVPFVSSPALVAKAVDVRGKVLLKIGTSLLMSSLALLEVHLELNVPLLLFLAQLL